MDATIPAQGDAAREIWPALPYEAWKDSLDTLHMWTQIVGKVKLELVPFLNEWWQVAFTVTARGLTTAIRRNRLDGWVGRQLQDLDRTAGGRR